LAFGTLVFGLFEHKIEVFVLGRAFVFWEWWVLSCILTFVVCLSNFYELFLLKLPLRVCWSMLAVALLPERTCRSIAALGLLPLRTSRSVATVKWLPLSSYRGAAGMLSPQAEYFATTGGTPPKCYCHHRQNAATAAGGDLVALSLL
ncbi:MAG: hypothetical protein KIG28_05665, partial [Bacteroidales bacterium]|nr:hypothetical protein [Bacteroidales bacterium]